MCEHSPNHPAVRVALAEARAVLESGPGVTMKVTADGVVSGNGETASLHPDFAAALGAGGAGTIEVSHDTPGDVLETFLAEARRGAAKVGAVPSARPATLAAPHRPHPDLERGPDRESAAGPIDLPNSPLARPAAALFGYVPVAPTSGDGSAPATRAFRPESASTQPVDETGSIPDPTDPDVRAVWEEPATLDEALKQFCRHPHPDRIEAVVGLATTEGPERRLAGIQALVQGEGVGERPLRLALARRLASSETVRLLVDRLATARDRSSRLAVLRVALALDEPVARELGTALSESQDRGARRCFLDALVALGPAAQEPVRAMTRDERWFVVRNGVRLLPDVAGQESMEELGGALLHPDGRVRKEAVASLVRLESEQAAALVQNVLDDEDPDVRSAAATAAGVLGGSGVGRVLSDRLDAERDPDVTVNVIRALARVGHGDAVAQLEKRTATRLFSRTPKAVRIAALRALWSLGTQPARSAVMQALEDRDPAVRGSVRALLGGR